MKASGIVCEYNPIHNGHIYQIKKTKEITGSDKIICVMSGNFTQRGSPAIINKWKRTLFSLSSGADLVLELPVVYSLSSAEFFASGAVTLLNSLGVTDYLSFGSECGDIEKLNKLASILVEEPYIFKNIIKSKMDLGLSYPTCRKLALKQLLNDTFYDCSILDSPNNILGIEYCKALKKINSNISPITISRVGSGYNTLEINSIGYSSASAIRKVIEEKQNIHILTSSIPSIEYEYINNLINENFSFPCGDKLIQYLKYKIITENINWNNIPDISEGLENKIIDNVMLWNTYNDLIMSIKSKRYTYTRISRILAQLFVGFDKFNIDMLRKQPCPYARILGFNDSGREILKTAKEKSSIPLITKFRDSENDCLQLDIQSNKAYSFINSSVEYNEDFVKGPIYLTKEGYIK